MGKRLHDLPPLPSAEFDAMVRRHEREIMLPARLRDIERWVATIKATPDDIRNKPDVRLKRDGGTFVSGVTDLDHLLDYCAAVRRKLEAGEFELALSSMRGLESTVRAINARVTEPLIETGRKVRDAAKRGGKQDLDRDMRMARIFQQRREDSGLSNSALMEHIGEAHGLKRSAAIDAVKRGLKKIVR